MTGAKTPGRGVKDIDPQRLARLNAGEVQSATLTEGLAIDFAALMGNILPAVGPDALAEMDKGAATGISRRMALAARLISESQGDAALDFLAQHASDTARGWACFMIGTASRMNFQDRLAAIQRFADDPHFGVREWAWLAVRPHLASELEQTITLLSEWTASPSERIRRFASESIRPRGVWCAHIAELKAEPQRGLPVLELLRSDPSVYVRDSVGNWLNDAGKDQPGWVQDLCARWTSQSPTRETAHICKRALRSIQATR